VFTRSKRMLAPWKTSMLRGGIPGLSQWEVMMSMTKIGCRQHMERKRKKEAHGWSKGVKTDWS